MGSVPDHLMIVGSFGAPFGVRGWLKINSFTDPVTNILDYKPWQIKRGDGQWHNIKVISGRAHGKGIVVQVKGISDRDIAIEHRGMEIAVARNMLPELDSKEVYWSELVGMEVLNQQGKLLGKIDDVFGTGANDVMVVSSPERKESILIPYVLDHFVTSIDKLARVVTVDWQENYLE